jgi:regulator of telomere elongation helicase 1
LNEQARQLMNRFKDTQFKTDEESGVFGMLDEQQQNQFHAKSSVIIYTSRTHSQLTQAMKEMKRICEYFNINAVAIGSRDQLCINAEVLKEGKTNSERNNLCQLKVKKRQCKYRENVDKTASKPHVLNAPIKDIEDLVSIGKSCNACPYYLSRDIASKADVVFMPYNYLLDPRMLKSFKINLNNAVVILDEAHNIEKVCEETASINFSSTDITNCINDITHIMKVISNDNELLVDDAEENKDFSIEDAAKLKEIILKFESAIDSIDSVFSKQGKTYHGGKLFELFKCAEIDHATYPMIRSLISSLITFLTQSSTGSLFGRKGGGLVKFLDVLETAFESSGKFCLSLRKLRSLKPISFLLFV